MRFWNLGLSKFCRWKTRRIGCNWNYVVNGEDIVRFAAGILEIGVATFIGIFEEDKSLFFVIGLDTLVLKKRSAYRGVQFLPLTNDEIIAACASADTGSEDENDVSAQSKKVMFHMEATTNDFGRTDASETAPRSCCTMVSKNATVHATRSLGSVNLVFLGILLVNAKDDYSCTAPNELTDEDRNIETSYVFVYYVLLFRKFPQRNLNDRNSVYILKFNISVIEGETITKK
ncbi:hypothetical protein FQA39_LY11408 [Lamprigera yunnana]|nr:hypothetical protein FQA39_LY11408 [Lamprigera yunnana]